MSSLDTHPVIVLITVNENETTAILNAFIGESASPVQVVKHGLTYNDLGIHGGNQIVHTISEMGANGIGASQQRTLDAVNHWQPKAIIAVGIAFGLDETKQRIGDILVSTQIQDYELSKIGANGVIVPRGDKPSSSDILLNRLRQIDASHKRSNPDWPTEVDPIIQTDLRTV